MARVMNSLFARILGATVFPLLLRAAAEMGEEQAAAPVESPAQRGYRFLLEKPYLSPDFDQQVFDELWKTWEAPLKAKAEQSTPDERRKMAYSRYGLVERPD